MSWPVEITVAGPPMGKERVRFVKATGRTFTPERTVNYEGRIALAGQQAMAGRPLFEGPLEVEFEAHVPIAASKPQKWKASALLARVFPVKKPDMDNVIKAASDGLNMIVWVDDSQITTLKAIKRYSDRPRLEIRVRPQAEGIFA